MRVKVFGGGAGYGPDGVMTSWAPNSTVEVPDGDKKAVAFYRRWIDDGTAELVEEAEPAKVEAEPAKATLTPAPAKPAAKVTKTAR